MGCIQRFFKLLKLVFLIDATTIMNAMVVYPQNRKRFCKVYNMQDGDS